jgi:excisionase family DNA binding protein
MLHRQPSPALAVSFREAAHLLGIDRGSTLLDLIHAGRLRPVAWGKRQRIPLEQVQELARTGFTARGRPGRALSRSRTSPAPGRIRDLEVDP